MCDTTPKSKKSPFRSVSSPQLLKVPDHQVMERIRGFKAKRGGAGRSADAENRGNSENSTDALNAKPLKGRDQYEQKVKVERRELEQKYVELLAKLDDTESFWKDDSRRKDRRIAELERGTKALEDTASFLNIKLKMLEQELADQKEENANLKAQLDAAQKQQRANAVKYSTRFY